MYSLYDVSMTMDLGDISCVRDAVDILKKEGLEVGIMCGFDDDGDYFEMRVDVI